MMLRFKAAEKIERGDLVCVDMDARTIRKATRPPWEDSTALYLPHFKRDGDIISFPSDVMDWERSGSRVDDILCRVGETVAHSIKGKGDA